MLYMKKFFLTALFVLYFYKRWFLDVNVFSLFFFVYLTNVRTYSRPILGSTIECWPFWKHAKGGFFGSVFSKRCLFFIKMPCLVNINFCPKFLEYVLHVFYTTLNVSLLSEQNRRIIDISNEYCDTAASLTKNFIRSFLIML